MIVGMWPEASEEAGAPWARPLTSGQNNKSYQLNVIMTSGRKLS